MKSKFIILTVGFITILMLSGCRGQLATVVDVEQPNVAGFEIHLSGLVVDALNEDPSRLQDITSWLESDLGVTPAVTRTGNKITIGLREVPLTSIVARSSVTGVGTLVIVDNMVLLELVQPYLLMYYIVEAADDPSLSATIFITTSVAVVLISQETLLLKEGNSNHITTSGTHTTIVRPLFNTGSATWKFSVSSDDRSYTWVLILGGTLLGLLIIVGLTLYFKSRRRQERIWDAPSS